MSAQRSLCLDSYIYSAALFQVSIKKVISGVIASKPVAVQQKVVHVIRKNELMDHYAVGPQARDEIDRLRKVDVTIVVDVDEKYRRLPRFNRSDRRRFVSELGQIRRNVLAVPIVGGPIVNTMKIDTGGENVRVAREAHGGEKSALTSRPPAAPRRIAMRSCLQILPG